MEHPDLWRGRAIQVFHPDSPSFEVSLLFGGLPERVLAWLDARNPMAFEDLDRRFDFPVTALIGPNGGGKTTIRRLANWRASPSSSPWGSGKFLYEGGGEVTLGETDE